MFNFADVSINVIVLLLRVAVVFLLYFFLWQVLRVVTRDLRGGVANEAAVSPYGKLEITSAGQSGFPVGKTFPLAPVVSIGRSLESDIALNDNFMSSQHASLELRGDEWVLEDFNSTNGTFVNGFEVRVPTAVNYGDVIRVGRVELKVVR